MKPAATASINFGSGQGGGINDFDNLTVVNSTLTGNQAVGTPLAPGAVPSQTPNSGSTTAGGGVFCLGVYVPNATVSVADSTLTGNQAIGGAGAAGSAGSVGEGGGISLIAVPSALVADCMVADNVAQGGAGGTGGVGATGVSGGIDLAFGSVVTVSNTILLDNQAIGGAGGAGAEGGDGVGGGMNVGSGVITGSPDDCSLTLTDSILVGNQAIGGAGGSGSNGGARPGRRPLGLGGELRIDRFHMDHVQRRAGWRRRHGRRQRPGPGRWPLHRHNCRRDARQVDRGHFQLCVDER